MLDRFWVDKQGYDAIWFDKDAIEQFTIDWSRRLASGTTISSATVNSDGATIDSSSNTTTSVTFTISGDPGDLTSIITLATLSDGQKKSHTLRVYPREM